MSSADSIPQWSDARSPVVAAELGSARLEGAEPDADLIGLAEAFAAGELSETDFDAAVQQHQQVLVAESRQRLFIAGQE